MHKPSKSKLKSNKKYKKEKIVHNYLLTKYSRFKYSYSFVCLNNLIFNEHCMIVARFKDFLILDDMTEFLRRFYSKIELKRRLIKIFKFYESYSKIFPNYMILDENKYLYRNIRKKQKIIDAYNQIKKEEEENRKNLKKDKKREIIIFNKSIQESINRHHPSGGSFLFNSIISEFMKNNNESNMNSLISISLNKQNILNNKNKFSNKNSKLNSFEYSDYDKTLNSENSLINIVQLLNAKYDNINSNVKENNNYNQINLNNKNNYNDLNTNKNIKNYIDKNNKNKNLIKKNSKSKKSNITYENSIKNERNENEEKMQNQNNNIINNDLNFNICTPPKTTSPGHNQKIKRHNHQKSALNNNKKFISHKTAVSVSNNNNNNTIKIINNINNIIINDANINKEMVININTNYFELNSSNLNTLNKINNNNIKKNIRNTLFKKVNKNNNSINNNKEISLNNKKNTFYQKKINSNLNNQKKLINNTTLEKRINAYNNKIINFEKHHFNSNSNNINYDNNNIINNNIINIHNRIASQYTSKNNENKFKKQNNMDNKGIKRTTDYKSFILNNMKNNNNNNKLKNNYIKSDKNKKTITIDVRSYEKNKKTHSKKKKLKTLMVTDSKRICNKTIFNPKIQNKRTLEIMNTEGNINCDGCPNTFINYYNKTEYNNTLNANDKNNFQSIKSNQIKSKLNKKILARKQKTNSLHINSKNKNKFFSSFCNSNKIVKELNLLKNNNNIIIENNNFINEHAKNNTQGNLDLESKKVKKYLTHKDCKNVSERKNIKKISTKEMKEKYHKFIQRNKIIHGSYDTSNRLHIFKKFSSLYNSNVINNNITDISHGKIVDIKSPNKYTNNFNTEGNKVLKTNEGNTNTNMVGNSYKNHEKSSYTKKMTILKKEFQDKNKHFIYKINGLKNQIFISDINNKKMKFVKK